MFTSCKYAPLIRGTVSSCRLYKGVNLFSTAKTDCVKFEIKNGVGFIKLNDTASSVNILNSTVIREIDEAFKQIKNSPEIKAGVIMSGKANSFIAGADIKMIDSCQSEDALYALASHGQTSFSEIEQSKKPIIAAIMGSCLGGGNELALACHYRIAVKNKNTVIGQPEIMLGIIPGAGGTVRLPRLCNNVIKGTDLLLTGKSITAVQAKKLGLVDEVVSELGEGARSSDENTMKYLEELAIKVALDLSTKDFKRGGVKLSYFENIVRLFLKVPFIKTYFYKRIHSSIMAKTKGLYPAPLKLLQLLKQQDHFKDLKLCYDAEARSFAQLAMSEESKALRHLYHSQVSCKKNAAKKTDKAVSNVFVVGAGLMGSGIAFVTSLSSKIKTVNLLDQNEAALNSALTQIDKLLTQRVSRRKLSAFEKEKTFSKINSSLSLSSRNLEKVDVVIEAVAEDLNVKRKVLSTFEDLTQHNNKDCVFASNTSAISITEIAAGCKRPENVIGMHYFSPVHRMQLLEVVRSKNTSQETLNRALLLGASQSKLMIVVNDSPGFYTTRILAAALDEVVFLLQCGISPHFIDESSLSFGFPIGTISLIDEVGLDVAEHIASYLKNVFGKRFSVHDSSLLQSLVQAGILGKKSKVKGGIYKYDSANKFYSFFAKKKREENPTAMEIIKRNQISCKSVSQNSELIDRIVLRLLNECAMCLEEGVLVDAKAGDIGAVYGLGFPPFLGGPLLTSTRSLLKEL